MEEVIELGIIQQKNLYVGGLTLVTSGISERFEAASQGS